MRTMSAAPPVSDTSMAPAGVEIKGAPLEDGPVPDDGGKPELEVAMADDASDNAPGDPPAVEVGSTNPGNACATSCDMSIISKSWVQTRLFSPLTPPATVLVLPVLCCRRRA